MRLSRAACGLSVGLALAGCVPFPHWVGAAPRVSGKVVRSGQPAANVSLALRTGSTLQASTRTDSGGFFAFPRPSMFLLFYAPLVAPIRVNHWDLMMGDDGGLSGFHGLNSQARDERLILICDLDQPVSPAEFKRGWRQESDKPQYCRIVDRGFE